MFLCSKMPVTAPERCVTSRNLRAKRIKVVGAIASFAFQRASHYAEQLHRCMPMRYSRPEVEGLFEIEWHDRLKDWRHLHGAKFYRLKRSVAVFVDDEFVGSDIELLKITCGDNIFVEGVPRKNTQLLKERFADEYLGRMRRSENVYCYFDICVDSKFVGTLVFQLYSDILPKTCENFTSLCLGTKGGCFSYKGSRIHRIVKNGWLQGGDIQYKTGGGGFSIYNSLFEDECYGISHDRRGVLSMANHGRHTNGSQFFITLKPTTWMDTYYVAFGQLIEGVKVLNALENVQTFQECPLQTIEIKNCGRVDLEDEREIAKSPKEAAVSEAAKKSRKIEKVANQLMRLIMEAVTEALAIKEYVPDILHEGDVPSAMNLQLYFQGFYSLPEEILERTAKYFRTLRRELLRSIAPTATEVVEVITYDLLVAVMVQLVDLDDVRGTTGEPMYEKLVGGIDMEIEMVQKPYVKKFVDQLADTAETIVKLISRKLMGMWKGKTKTKMFSEQMNEWILSFARQETFADDNFYITDREPYDLNAFVNIKPFDPCDHDEESVHSEKEIKREDPDKKKKREPCCPEEKKEKKRRIRKPQTQEEICCYGKEDSDDDDELRFSDYFSACRYDLKTIKKDRTGKIPLVDLIEMSRYHLRMMRHHEARLRSKARICLEKRINKWMKDVDYVPETQWVRQTVFKKEDICFSHTEEMLYGAMTIGLLEMYFLMEEYLKHPKKKKYRMRVIYPEDQSSSRESEEVRGEIEEESPCSTPSTIVVGAEPIPARRVKNCTCGDVCCTCEPEFISDETSIDKMPPTPPTPPPSPQNVSLEGEMSPEGIPDELLGPESCISSVVEIDVEDLLAQVMGDSESKVDIKSFKWLQDYILEEGCLLKTKFVTQVHTWLEDEVFNYQGFLSKHSLVTRASLLSLSFSLASLFQENNELKTELKDFIFDLWHLYFRETFKEALLEFPPTEEEPREEELKAEAEGSAGEKTEDDLGKTTSDVCAELLKEIKQMDFDEFCRVQAGGKASLPSEETTEADDGKDVEESAEHKEPEQEIAEPLPDTTEKEPHKDAHETEHAEPPKPAEEEARGEHEDEEEEVPDEVAQEKQAELAARKTKSPIIVREPIESEEEIRQMPPYMHPFWVKFLAEITKRALGLLSKISRLPRRLYFTTDSEISFDDKMKKWVEFNNFSPPRTGAKDIRDFIASHHVSLEDLDTTARSFLRKRVIAQVIEKSSRTNSALELAEELLMELLLGVMDKVDKGEGGRKGTQESLWDDLLATAVKSSIEAFGEDYGDGYDEASIRTNELEATDTETKEDAD